MVDSEDRQCHVDRVVGHGKRFGSGLDRGSRMGGALDEHGCRGFDGGKGSTGRVGWRLGRVSAAWSPAMASQRREHPWLEPIRAVLGVLQIEPHP